MPDESREGDRIPLWQVVFDDPFLLLALGLALPLILYVVWGILEVSAVPLHRP